MTTYNEPDACGAAVRRFTDPAYQPRAATPGELRDRIDALEPQIVALLAEPPGSRLTETRECPRTPTARKLP